MLLTFSRFRRERESDGNSDIGNPFVACEPEVHQAIDALHGDANRAAFQRVNDRNVR